ncbi:MAG: TolB family protein, partial [Anaerolineales bacterium]
MLNLTQLLQVPGVDITFDISPNTDRLAFAWNKAGEWQIYEMDLDSPGNLKPITAGAGGKFNPRYSPDGTHLAYVLDMDGSESYHLVIHHPATGTHTDITPSISYALQPNFCWSPDGRRLAFLSNQNGCFSAYIVSSNGGNAKLILDTGHPAWQVEWSPDGRHLAVCCEMNGQDYGIFIVNLETEEVIELKFNAQDPKWSPDGVKLAFHIDVAGWLDIGAYDMNKKQIDWIIKRENDSHSLAIMETRDSLLNQQSQILVGKQTPGLRVAYIKTCAGNSWMEIPDGDKWRTYQIGKGVHNGIKFTPDLKRMVSTFNSPGQPPDLWMIDIEQGTSIQLTKSMPEEL